MAIDNTVVGIKNSVVTKVPAGSKTVLECNSNDFAHNFMFWLFDDTNNIIGPGGTFDERKYKYEVLSGNLTIDRVSPSESGNYKCVSKNIDGSGYSVGEVQMLVTGSAFSAIDVVKLAAILTSLVVIIGCAVLYYKLRQDWNKYEGRTLAPVDDPDEEDGDEIYNTTTTAISQPVPGPSRNLSSEHLLYGIDNQGLDTDFNSVFENIQIKSPNASLI